MYDNGLTPVQAMSNIISAAEFTKREDWHESEKEFVEYLEDLGVKEIVKIMNDAHDKGLYLDWYPSRYNLETDKTYPYPEILAEALVLSKDKESFTDATNSYYKGYSLTDKAKKIFLKDALKDKNTSLKMFGIMGAKPLSEFIKKHPKFVKKLFTQASKSELELFFESSQEGWGYEDLEDLYEAVPELLEWQEKNLPDFDPGGHF